MSSHHRKQQLDMADQQDTAKEVFPWTDFQNPQAARLGAGVRDFSPRVESASGQVKRVVDADAPQVDDEQPVPDPDTETPPAEPGSSDTDETKSTQVNLPPA